MAGQLENDAAIGANALEHGACIMKAMGQDMNLRVAPRNQFSVEPYEAVAIVHRNHLKISRNARFGRGKDWRHALFRAKVGS